MPLPAPAKAPCEEIVSWAVAALLRPDIPGVRSGKVWERCLELALWHLRNGCWPPEAPPRQQPALRLAAVLALHARGAPGVAPAEAAVARAVAREAARESGGPAPAVEHAARLCLALGFAHPPARTRQAARLLEILAAGPAVPRERDFDRLARLLVACVGPSAGGGSAADFVEPVAAFVRRCVAKYALRRTVAGTPLAGAGSPLPSAAAAAPAWEAPITRLACLLARLSEQQSGAVSPAVAALCRELFELLALAPRMKVAHLLVELMNVPETALELRQTRGSCDEFLKGLIGSSADTPAFARTLSPSGVLFALDRKVLELPPQDTVSLLAGLAAGRCGALGAADLARYFGILLALETGGHCVRQCLSPARPALAKAVARCLAAHPGAKHAAGVVDGCRRLYSRLREPLPEPLADAFAGWEVRRSAPAPGAAGPRLHALQALDPAHDAAAAEARARDRRRAAEQAAAAQAARTNAAKPFAGATRQQRLLAPPAAARTRREVGRNGRTEARSEVNGFWKSATEGGGGGASAGTADPLAVQRPKQKSELRLMPPWLPGPSPDADEDHRRLRLMAARRAKRLAAVRGGTSSVRRVRLSETRRAAFVNRDIAKCPAIFV